VIEDVVALTHRRLIAIVRGVVPLRAPDLPFVSLEDDDGRVTPIESAAAGHRHFAWRSLTVPTRPADRVSCVVTWRRLLRVRYDHNGDDEALELLMAQDAIRIVDALRIPTDCQMGTTGILSVVQDGDPGTTTLPGEGTARIIILGFPFTIEMEACC